ncbi:MAG TPA: hypothetical protein VEV41_16500 [Terriglobales bacterium]|nr:hypothetical protein [Terriglobales bacterium]
MIPTLTEAAHSYGTSPFVLALVFAALLTGGVLLAQSLAAWFADRDS